MLTQPSYWTNDMPAYHSEQGWEFEKERAKEVARMQVRIKRLDRLYNKAFDIAMTVNGFDKLKYLAISNRLLQWNIQCGERLLFDYNEPIWA